MNIGVCMVPAMLAQEGGDLGNLIYLGVFLVLSLIGTILQSRKAEQNKRAEQQKRAAQKPTPPEPARPVPPPTSAPGPAPRRPAPPPVSAPQPAPRPAAPSQPVLPRPAPPAREVQVMRQTPTYTPAELRRAAQQREARQRVVRPEPVVAAVAVLPVEEVAAPPLGAPLPVPGARGDTMVQRRVQQMLRSGADLQAAFVLAEVLGPPLALRERELF